MIFTKRSFSKYRIAQYFSAFAASLGGLCTGTLLAWSSAVNYLQPQGKYQESFQISENDIPLAAAVVHVGALVFAYPSMKLADFVGRTPTMLFAMVLFLLNWIMTAFARHVTIIVIARFLGGMAMGAVYIVSNMYTMEIASKQNRFLMSTGFNIFRTQGLVFVNLFALFSSWQEYHLLPALFPLLFALCFLILPESPTYLVSRGETIQAKNTLMLLRQDKDAEKEFKRLQEAHFLASKEDNESLKELFTKKTNLHALAAGLGVSVYQQLSNINGFNCYAHSILDEAEASLSPCISAITVNAFQMCAILSTIFFLEKAKRKFLLTLSAFGMAFGHLGLGMYFQLKHHDIHFPFMGFIPIILLVAYMIAYSIGFGSLTSLLSRELFEPNVMGYASGIMIAANWLTGFFVIYVFPMMLENLEIYETFYIFAVVAISAIFFVALVLPETIGSSFVSDGES